MKKRELTTFGIAVRKRLLDKHWTLTMLADEIGVKTHFLSAMLYGDKKGYRYVEPIKELLGMTDESWKDAAANE